MVNIWIHERALRAHGYTGTLMEQMYLLFHRKIKDPPIVWIRRENIHHVSYCEHSAPLRRSSTTQAHAPLAQGRACPTLSLTSCVLTLTVTMT